jgi:predicted HTH domain antitoxin
MLYWASRDQLVLRTKTFVLYRWHMAAMDKITLDLPSPLAEELAAASQAFLIDLLERGLRETRIERALERYTAGGITFAAAATLAGIPRSDFARHAYARGIEPPYSDQLLAAELL